MAGVLRGTRRGEGLIGIPFLLLGDSEGKRRVDLEASLSTRSLTVCKVCQTGGEEAGGGTCDGASSSLLLLLLTLSSISSLRGAIFLPPLLYSTKR